MKTVEVVAALIRKDGRVFATQRGSGPWKDGWEFPGGKIEPGERPEAALRREIREELGAEIAVEELLTTVEYDYPEFHLRMGCYLARLTAGGLKLLEHEAARWLRWDELDAVAWLPADRSILPELRKKLLAEAFEAAERDIPPGRYRHFKGREYEVLGIARHSETEEPLVVYRKGYGDGSLWVRPAAMWNEIVERDGKAQRRFTWVPDPERR